VERHHGVWGGCWCLEFHAEGRQRGPERRDIKARKLRQGTAHAALVSDAARCVGWCKYGAATELPRIKHVRVYAAGATPPPGWRTTCLFVNKAYRGQGVASAAMAGALQLIAQAGGGSVESYPEDTAEPKVSDAFLYNSRLAMFERMGFARVRPLGRHHWVVAARVAAS
jgi:GNAT superfamily N-acetyltransferase